MKRLAVAAFGLLVIVSGVHAQTAPDATELTKLLRDFLAGASVNDPAVHERFWADDLIYTRSAGRRVSKEEIMRDVRSAPAPKPSDPKTVYTAEDIQIQQYGDTAIVAFRLVSTTEMGERKQVAHNLNSGTFVKRNGKWQVVSWQSTRVPRTEEESRREIGDIEATFHEALASANVEKLASLTHPTFTWTKGSSQMGQKQMIDDLVGGRLKYQKPAAGSSNVSVFGDTAVVRGEWTGEKAGRFTLTFLNLSGAWKALALHTTH